MAGEILGSDQIQALGAITLYGKSDPSDVVVRLVDEAISTDDPQAIGAALLILRHFDESIHDMLIADLEPIIDLLVPKWKREHGM